MDSTVVAAILGAIATIAAAIISAVISKRRKDDRASVLQVPKDNLKPTSVKDVIDVKVRKDQSEQLAKTHDAVVSGMRDLKYSDETIDAFRTTYTELTTNALEHGCRTDDDSVHVIIEANSSYISLIVVNPKGRTVNLARLLENSRMLLSNDLSRRRGRGLLLVKELTDILDEAANGYGVKAVFFRERVSFKIEVRADEDLTIIEVEQGLYNPSCQRRLLNVASQYVQTNLILDFRRWVASTIAHFVILELSDLYLKSRKQIVALIVPTRGQQSSEAVLPDSIVAYTWEEALRKIFKPTRSDKKIDPRHVKHAEQIRNSRK